MYDFKKGKVDVLNILNNDVDVVEKEKIPNNDGEWTYDNGIKSWVGAIFVDLRESKEFFENQNSKIVAKVMRAYISEIIQILNSVNHVREIGVRGDCVYGIFGVPNTQVVYEVGLLTFYINTYMKMLNILLEKNGYDKIYAGIGYAISQDLIVKVGKKGTGINDKVWIGKALAEADRLSKITNKKISYSNNRTQSIAFSDIAYLNAIKEKDISNIFKEDISKNYYFSFAIIPDFDNWIKEGMSQ